MKKILVINGPNLNMLGAREPEIYGHQTIADIEKLCQKAGKELGFSIDFRQSNAEAEMINWIQESGKFSALIVNAAAYTHTSVAIYDALLAVKIPVVEVHLSNIFRREEFRHHSYVSRAAKGVICGFGADSYLLALKGLKELLDA